MNKIQWNGAVKLRFLDKTWYLIPGGSLKMWLSRLRFINFSCSVHTIYRCNCWLNYNNITCTGKERLCPQTRCPWQIWRSSKFLAAVALTISNSEYCFVITPGWDASPSLGYTLVHVFAHGYDPQQQIQGYPFYNSGWENWHCESRVLSDTAARPLLCSTRSWACFKSINHRTLPLLKCDILI